MDSPFRRHRWILLSAVLALFVLCSCSDTKKTPAVRCKLAVISDLHLWYPETDLSDEDQQVDLPALKFGWLDRAILNESAAITDAVINDAIESGAEIIVLNGDLVDSAERAVFDTLAALLKEKEAEYGIEFFFVRGNHDTPNGDEHEFGAERSEILLDGTVLNNSRNYEVGARELYEIFGPFGLSPYKNGVDGEQYIHWERGPEFEPWPPDLELTQFSYLVEPVEDLWLLVIDTDSGGWRALKEDKPETWAWIAEVYRLADAEGKTVLAFGHHPIGDPFGGLLYETLCTIDDPISQELKISREIADEMAEAGMHLFISGHLHMDYIFRHTYGDETLIDLQIPTLKHYPVGYRMLTLSTDDTLDVETRHVRDVPGWNRYWDVYEAYADTGNYPWEEYGLLEAETFDAFINAHWDYYVIEEILDYIPEELFDLLNQVSMYTLLLLAEIGEAADARVLEDAGSPADLADLCGPGVIPAAERLNEKIEAAGLAVEDLKDLSLYDYIKATVRVQMGAALALEQMTLDGSLDQYRFCAELIKDLEIDSSDVQEGSGRTFELFDRVLFWLISMMEHVWEKPYQGPVTIDLRNGSIIDLE